MLRESISSFPQFTLSTSPPLSLSLSPPFFPSLLPPSIPVLLCLSLRLDVSEQNCGHKVLGYAVYIDGALRSKVMDPIASHSEVNGLENGMQYQFQVR